MKTKILISSTILILISFLLIGGCATISGMKEPASPESTLLFGRIKLTCSDFPRGWDINGEHTGGIKVHLMDTSTKEVIQVKSRGVDGLFSLIDPDAECYVIVGFELMEANRYRKISLSYRAEDNPYICIQKNSVNNLGDIMWNEVYGSELKTEHGELGPTTTMITKGSHDFIQNYDEVKNWFKGKYPDSAWNNKNWKSVEYKNL
jgi:hypothetical protein